MRSDPYIELHPDNHGSNPSYGPPDPAGDNWAMAAHLSALCGYLLPFGHVLGPLVVWLFKGRQYPQVDHHGKEALNFQISITLYLLVSMFLILVGIGVVLVIALSLFDLVMILVATVKTRGSETFRYPLSIRFIK
ncbi:DUF4870 domain-containing protein [Geoalkalibacter halelectricus]|uniref:DUF4870 domain-containing protein n=1 Tax=Geoalkalibacter halelectricus TaxID=2847045 RepID=A0ABY5ZQY7_9BACT|nr:DUF4870 domain-containing protein [Geoalkalibacter halelectricus]MDO3378583.1 DUF4870 domain-containing protein [Geoalkalibacter halelectricus]UWZ80104.1 DUF4870 domain-containing protein [Geoalkalibacter halelectricus]